jgi:hypothetical protein
MHGTRLKDAAVGREERAVKGSDGWRAFLNKGWDAVAIAPAHSHTSLSSATISASSILNTTPTPTYTSTNSLNSTLNTTNTSLNGIPIYTNNEAARTNSGNNMADAGELNVLENTCIEGKEKESNVKLMIKSSSGI